MYMIVDILLFAAIAIITIRTIMIRNRYKKLKEIFKDKASKIHLLLIVAFILISYAIVDRQDTDDQHSRLIDSIKKGLIAFIIAVYGELGMILSPFWTVFLVSYFLNGWV